jgi:hypothetical protein
MAVRRIVFWTRTGEKCGVRRFGGTGPSCWTGSGASRARGRSVSLARQDRREGALDEEGPGVVAGRADAHADGVPQTRPAGGGVDQVQASGPDGHGGAQRDRAFPSGGDSAANDSRGGDPDRRDDRGVHGQGQAVRTQFAGGRLLRRGKGSIARRRSVRTSSGSFTAGPSAARSRWWPRPITCCGACTRSSSAASHGTRRREKRWGSATRRGPGHSYR